MEHADWLEGGFDSAQARFLMGTAITHHRFSSPVWGETELIDESPAAGFLAKSELSVRGISRILGHTP
jgi:hypothetical protein